MSAAAILLSRSCPKVTQATDADPAQRFREPAKNPRDAAAADCYNSAMTGINVRRQAA